MVSYGYIYLTYDILKDMYYVGQHKSKTYDPNYLGSGRIIKNIIKKRPETLKNYVLEWCENKETLNESEIRWVAYFREAEGFDKCYNLCDGGGSTGGFKFNPQQLYNLSEAHKGYKHTEEQKKKISESLKKTILLNGSPSKGRKLTDEHKKKISEANKGKKISDKCKSAVLKSRSKPVVQLTLEGDFIASYPSAREAERQTGVGYVSISCCCNKKFKTSGGFIWCFENEYKNKII